MNAYYVKKNAFDFYELRQNKYRNIAHPSDLCAVESSEDKLRDVYIRLNLTGGVDWLNEKKTMCLEFVDKTHIRVFGRTGEECRENALLFIRIFVGDNWKSITVQNFKDGKSSFNIALKNIAEKTKLPVYDGLNYNNSR